MQEHNRHLAGLQTRLIADGRRPTITIVFLHGYAMCSADLTPFAHSLAIPGAAYVFPEAPLAATDGGRAWWAVDGDSRAAALGRGARDLVDQSPCGRDRARSHIRELLATLTADGDGEPLLLAGFSQGGMLACDTVLMDDVRVDALAMLSSSRIAGDDWMANRSRLGGVRAFVSHGHADRDLAFSAGEQLKNFLTDSGAVVTWMPFDGGHEIPFVVWRKFRRFAHETVRLAAFTHKKH
ncbi:MAG: esterase [Steroidobacteraceae bacterium]